MQSICPRYNQTIQTVPGRVVYAKVCQYYCQIVLFGTVSFQKYFDRNDIAGWCEAPGALATWNIFRRGFADEGDHAPDIVLDHSRCMHADKGLSDVGHGLG